MAAVVREIERKYDASPAGTAALDAVESMIGVPGVAAVSRQDPEILDAVYMTPEICGWSVLGSRCGGARAAMMRAGT